MHSFFLMQNYIRPDLLKGILYAHPFFDFKGIAMYNSASI